MPRKYRGSEARGLSPNVTGYRDSIGTGRTEREGPRGMNVTENYADYRVGRDKRKSRSTVTGPEHGTCGSIMSLSAVTEGKYGQARKGPWWMPRSYCTMKAVVSCEKPRGGAHIPRSADGRMG